MSNSNGFLIDNSPSTQLKYDIVTSKFITGFENHNKRNAPVPSPVAAIGLVGAVLEGIVVLLVLLVAVVLWM